VSREQLPGRSPYRSLWLAGLVFWLPALYWLCLAHWATSFGWLALCAYLSIYLPLFVALSRVAVWRLQLPLIVVAPVVWTGLEYAQAHILSGFNMASVAHSQYRQLALMQIVDLVGQYGVSFLVFLGAAAITCALPRGGGRARPWLLLPAAAVIAAAITYGFWRQAQYAPHPGPTVTLVQGNIDTELKFDPDASTNVYQHYLEWTARALASRPKTDLVVWPETMFRDALFEWTDDATLPPEAHWTFEELREYAANHRRELARLTDLFQAPLLLGLDTIELGPGSQRRRNSALMVERTGRPGARYDKSHPVVFGEYVPFAEDFPWLYYFTPLGTGIVAGTRSPGMELPTKEHGTPKLAVNICYESALAHVIRRQVAGLVAEGNEPDILMNLTNDGWFWGSHELDLHLICGVFRAIECRKPLLIAANTGFSAWIDGNGRIVEQAPRHEPGFIVADVELDNRRSFYLAWGDWFAGLCSAASVAFGLIGIWQRRHAS
jgi:apolipoprotein N-acyltransferase